MSMFTIAGAPTIEEGDMELIFSETLTSASNSVTTGTLATGFSSYLVTQRARVDRANNQLGFCNIYFNGDTGSNYQHLRNDCQVSMSNFRTLVQDVAGTFLNPAAGGDANFYGGAEMRVFSPESTTGFKSFQILGGANMRVDGSVNFSRINLVINGVWRNTAAITSITFQEVSTNADGSSADFEVGSTFKVYGLK